MNIAVTAIYIAIFSWHNVCGPGCNQSNNPAIGVDFVHKSAQYTAVSYNNSNCNRSLLFAKREKYFSYGAVTGYANVPVPFIAPVISLGPVVLSCLSDTKTTVCMAAFKWRF